MSWENGWLWLIAAVLLAGLELALPGYIFLGTALALALVGLALLIGLWPFGFSATLVVAAVLSALCWLALRRLMGVQEGQVRIWENDINDN